MIEAGVLVDVKFEPIFWHLPEDRSGGALPDSHDLWEIMWENRETLGGFAHSHPGSGTPYPSHTDITTFKAVEAGLGRRLVWWICSADDLISCVWQPSIKKYVIMADISGDGIDSKYVQSYTWLDKLREHSNY